MVYTLTNNAGLEADITTLGGRVMRLSVHGIDVVLGFDTEEDYMPDRHASDFGAIIGRYANRLAGGKITVDGHVYQLPQNNGPNCLHGGPSGWQYAMFVIEEASARRLVLTHVSPDGDNGFPGTVKVRVVYTLLDANPHDKGYGALRVDYHAETDRTTVINMTNHSYFNLDGCNNTEQLPVTSDQGLVELPLDCLASLATDHCPLTTVNSHLLQIDADRYTPVDETSIPLGHMAAVEGTPFDFRTAKPIRQDIDADDGQLRIGRGYDHNYVLNHPGLDKPSAVLTSSKTGISMELFTTAPGIQLYTGNFLDGVVGKGGVSYPVRSAVCLETQQYPDSPNHSWPESTGYLYPDKPFDSTTIFQFTSVNK